jgi:hypothetical protein
VQKFHTVNSRYITTNHVCIFRSSYNLNLWCLNVRVVMIDWLTHTHTCIHISQHFVLCTNCFWDYPNSKSSNIYATNYMYAVVFLIVHDKHNMTILK